LQKVAPQPRPQPADSRAALPWRPYAQGPFIPAWRTLQRNWMPQGAERAWAQRIIGQSNNLSNVLAPAVTPYLAVKLGWQAVPLVYAAAIGGFALLWHATVTDHPPPARLAGLAARAAGKVAEKVGKRVGVAAPAPGGPGNKTVEWRIFSTRPVLCCIAARVFSDKGPILVWAPTYFMEALGCTPVQTGLLLAWTAPATVLGDFGSAAVESALLARGWPVPHPPIAVAAGPQLFARILELEVEGLRESNAAAAANPSTNGGFPAPKPPTHYLWRPCAAPGAVGPQVVDGGRRRGLVGGAAALRPRAHPGRRRRLLRRWLRALWAAQVRLVRRRPARGQKPIISSARA
jgi:MFS family permease